MQALIERTVELERMRLFKLSKKVDEIFNSQRIRRIKVKYY